MVKTYKNLIFPTGLLSFQFQNCIYRRKNFAIIKSYFQIIINVVQCDFHLINAELKQINKKELFSLEKEEEGIAPHFISPIKPLMVEEHKPAVLECVVTGKPTPEVKWYRGEKEVKPKKGKTEIIFTPETGESKLTILEPTTEDETIYRVRATNKFGKAECRANLLVSNAPVIFKPEVLRAPKITKPLPALVAQIGKPLSLIAEFESTPKPEVKWFKNGVEIAPTDDTVVNVYENTAELRITETNKKDTGKYEIRVQNPAGEARSSGSVTVKDIKEDTEAAKAPRFIQPIQPQVVAEGEVVIMETVVESYPVASFQWFHDNRPLQVCISFIK